MASSRTVARSSTARARSCSVIFGRRSPLVRARPSATPASRVVGAGLRVGRVDEATDPLQRLWCPLARVASRRRARSDRGGRSGHRRPGRGRGVGVLVRKLMRHRQTYYMSIASRTRAGRTHRPPREPTAAASCRCSRRSVLALVASEGDGGMNEALHGLLVDLLVLAEVDGPPCVPAQAGVEEAAGSSSAAPLAKVIFTMSLAPPPVQTIPECDRTGSRATSTPPRRRDPRP